MLLTDTDSLRYITETENVYEDFYKKKKNYLISAINQENQNTRIIYIT